MRNAGNSIASIEDRNANLSKKLNMNNTTRNFSTIMPKGVNLNGSNQSSSNVNNMTATNNSIVHAANIKLTPISKSKQHLSNL